MNLANFNPYPSVLLDESSPTNHCSNGYKVGLPNFCQKKLPSDELCIAHYKSLQNKELNTWVECPYGFSTFIFSFEHKKCAITGIIPYPRTDSENEKKRLKTVTDRVDVNDVVSFTKAMSSLYEDIADKISRDTSRNLAALHEIRKYNRNIKQSLERWCRNQSSSDPDLAAPEVVKSWKLSELMSYQFEILGLIADEGLAHIIPKTRSEIFKVFDKCQRIYRSLAYEKDIAFKIEGDSPVAVVSDKTFPIVATVLIENAIKYSPSNSEIIISIRNHNKDSLKVSIRNQLVKGVQIPTNIFDKGKRGDQDSEGSGIGLYLAQMVAKQHNTEIKYRLLSSNFQPEIEFFFEMKRMNDS